MNAIIYQNRIFMSITTTSCILSFHSIRPVSTTSVAPNVRVYRSTRVWLVLRMRDNFLRSCGALHSDLFT